MIEESRQISRFGGSEEGKVIHIKYEVFVVTERQTFGERMRKKSDIRVCGSEERCGPQIWES